MKKVKGLRKKLIDTNSIMMITTGKWGWGSYNRGYIVMEEDLTLDDEHTIQYIHDVL